MTSRPIAVTITAQEPGKTTKTLAATSDGIGKGPTPVDELVIEYGRPSPRDHADPGRISLTLAQDATLPPLALALDTKLTITATLDGYTVTLAICWVTGWTRDVDDSGVAWYSITADDVLGRAAGTMIADTPWPAQGARTRLARVNTLAREPLVNVNAFTDASLAPRDVDRVSVLDVVESSCWLYYQVHPGPTGLTAATNGGLQLSYGALTPRRFDGTRGVVEVPTDAVVDNGYRIWRGGRLTHVLIDAPDSAFERATTVWSWTLPGFSSVHQVTTDCVYWRGNVPGIDAYYNGLLSATRDAVVELEPTELLVDRLEASALAQLLDHQTRLTTVLHLVGENTAGLEPPAFVTAGTITVHGRDLLDLDVELTPAAADGIISARFRDFRTGFPSPTLEPLRFSDLKQDPANGGVPRIRDLDLITKG